MSSEIEQALLQMEQDIGDIDMGPDHSPAESEFLNWMQEFREGNDAINYAVRNLTVLDDEQSRLLDDFDRLEHPVWRRLWSELSVVDINTLGTLLGNRAPGWEEKAMQILEPHISNQLLYHWSQSLWSSMFMAYTEGKSYADVVSELGELEGMTEQDDIPIDMGAPISELSPDELWKRLLSYADASSDFDEDKMYTLATALGYDGLTGLVCHLLSRADTYERLIWFVRRQLFDTSSDTQARVKRFLQDAEEEAS